MRPTRLWTGLGRYPGKRHALRFGTIVAVDRREAIEALIRLWEDTLPIPPPDFEPIPGELVFVPGQSDG